MAYYQGNTYRRNGDEAYVVGAAGKIVVQTGGQIVPNSETQAATIAAVTSAASFDTAAAAALNGVIVALKGVGVLATS